MAALEMEEKEDGVQCTLGEHRSDEILSSCIIEVKPARLLCPDQISLTLEESCLDGIGQLSVQNFFMESK